MFIKLRSKIINYIMIQSIRSSYELGNISNNKVNIVKRYEKGEGISFIDVESIIYNYIHIPFKELDKIIPLNYRDKYIKENNNHNFYLVITNLKKQHQEYAENIFNTILQLLGIIISVLSLIILK